MTIDPAAYGDAIAPFYDEIHEGAFEPRTVQAAALLTELAAGGRALELGVGTGRLAVPLAEAGIEVHGVDSSQAMLDRLAAKSERVTGHLGDFATSLPGGPFRLVYVPFNTFFALLSQDDQIACFQSVAARLEIGGAFVLECFVPDLSLYATGSHQTSSVHGDCLFLSTSTVDRATQRIHSTQVVLHAGTQTHVPTELRYAWPSELDLMARLAGLRLRDRWGGWGREPFTSGSRAHVSVYAK